MFGEGDAALLMPLHSGLNVLAGQNDSGKMEAALLKKIVANRGALLEEGLSGVEVKAEQPTLCSEDGV
ncbi:MAG: hypothetical protein HY788_14565 [Deltaproteobacteria bacterium]|nr:hypothetical protein [Deltaproteobacteria bacterium]